MAVYDVVIVGSGIVGASAALLLAKNPELKIAIIEANTIATEWQKDTLDYRVSAISPASQHIFATIQVWRKITDKRISPYHEMQVWDASTDGALHFNCHDVNQAQLGFIIEDSVMRVSLFERIRECSNIDWIFPRKLIALSETENTLELTLECNQSSSSVIQTTLLIGADGANSFVRELANIEIETKDYEHTAIVTTVETTSSHQNTAWQRFLPQGPLAFLPLQDKNKCSIVWSTSHAQARELLDQSEDDFCKSLGEAFAHRLGEIKSMTKRYHFPLRMRHAKNYVKNRIALIGDAAHTIHPLAGQGVNLGLLDALALSETILQALEKNRNYASFATLRKYERARKTNNLMMLKAVDGLKNLFKSNASALQTLRSMGMKATQELSLLRNFFINYALGKS